MRMGLAALGKTLAAGAALVVAGLFVALRSDPVGQPAKAPVPLAKQAAAGDGRGSAGPGSPCADPGALLVPVEGVRRAGLSDTFNDARSEGRRHDALDILAPRGTPVVSAAPGRVEKLFQSDLGGNTVYVRSGDGRVLYYYAHLDAYAASLREGQSLARGARIGSVGYSGNADPAAPHLHFAMMATAPGRNWWEGGAALNPYALLMQQRGGGCPPGRGPAPTKQDRL